MPERGRRRTDSLLDAPVALQVDAIDETVVHDPQGRPWLVCTSEMPPAPDGVTSDPVIDAGLAPMRYETQIFYTARAGIRGFPTGHGEGFVDRHDAVNGHRQWCLRVRLGAVYPDLPPAEPV